MGIFNKSDKQATSDAEHLATSGQTTSGGHVCHSGQRQTLPGAYDQGQGLQQRGHPSQQATYESAGQPGYPSDPTLQGRDHDGGILSGNRPNEGYAEPGVSNTCATKGSAATGAHPTVGSQYATAHTKGGILNDIKQEKQEIQAQIHEHEAHKQEAKRLAQQQRAEAERKVDEAKRDLERAKAQEKESRKL